MITLAAAVQCQQAMAWSNMTYYLAVLALVIFALWLFTR